jgi:hypothetical protein
MIIFCFGDALALTGKSKSLPTSLATLYLYWFKPPVYSFVRLVLINQPSQQRFKVSLSRNDVVMAPTVDVA